ncbi:hypothetical protein NHP190012_09840 [Helicobacter sp. NHP19-012]|uniref:Uncharacterized protein n=2 Tax=Helicobacteraceae TaxID=72293 RepID=A0ABN6I8J3_9HELI|nr:hypothetical protein NHP190012_09840 [Helicobacter sp. NHP19-012]GMB96841.1 hypothetical protein NHP22001_14300 [Helicobacter sp. NHP22-001]
MCAVEMVEVAEPKYIPVYIAYFVIAVGLENRDMFFVVFGLIYSFIIMGKFSCFNPYLLFFGYNFYEISIDPSQITGDSHEHAKYKVFLISKRNLKVEKQYQLIRLKEFVFLDQYKQRKW